MTLLARSLVLFAAVCVVAAAGIAPAGADTTCPASNPPNELTLMGGTPQTAELESSFANPLQVALANSDGCPVTTAMAGDPIVFAAPSSGASGTFASTGTSSMTVGADATGSASAPMFVANDTAGSYTLTASSAYGSLTFSLTNTAAGLPATIVPVGPKSRSATVSTRYASPLEVRVLDANGNPVEGATVDFSLGSGGGGSSPGGSTGDDSGGGSAGATFDGGSSQATEQTGSDGIAVSPRFSADSTPGKLTATATTSRISEPASFSLDNLAGKAPTIAAIGTIRQSAVAGARYGHALEVKVRDGNGKPLQGATVTFTLGSGGGGGSETGGDGGDAAGAGASFVGGSSQATETTNAAGVAVSPRFDADTSVGRFTATAMISGTSRAVSFALDNLAGKAPVIRALRGARQSATVDDRFAKPLEVKVLDGHGKPLQGATVTFSLGSSGGGNGAAGTGGSGSAGSSAGASFAGGSDQATETTNAAGVAISPRVQANTIAGSFTGTATVASSRAVAGFLLRNLAGRPHTLTVGVAATESTTVGTRFPVRLAVTVTDGYGNAVAGAAVTFSAPARGASGRFAVHHGRARTVTVRTKASGIAVAPPFAADSAAGGYIVEAHAPHAAVAAFALVNQTAAQA